MSIPTSGIFPCLLLAFLLAFPFLRADAPKIDEAALQAAVKQAEELRRRGKPDEAVKVQGRALKIAEELYGADDPRTGDQMDSLARQHQAAGQHARAEPLLQRSLQIKEAKRGKDHGDVALALHNLAALYQLKAEYAKAETLARRGLGIKEKELGRHHPTIAASHGVLALIEGAQGEGKASARYIEEALRVSRRHSVTVLPALCEPEQLAFLHERLPYRLHLELSLALTEPGLAERAAEWLLNVKELPANVLAERAWLARDVGDSKRARQARELREVRLQLTRLTFPDESGRQPVDMREMARLSEREAELARDLGRRDARDSGWLALDELRKTLPTDTVFVDIVRFDPYDFRAKEKPWRTTRYVAWVVPAAGRGDVRLVDLGDAKKIDDAIDGVRKALREADAAIRASGEAGAEADYRKNARGLANLVLTPLLPHIEKASHWIVSPDGALWLVPWGALPLGEKGYVVEKYRLSHSVSGRDLLREGSGHKPSVPVLLADPDYGARAQSPERPGETPLLVARELASLAGFLPRFGSLPDTEREARALASHLKAFTGAEPALLIEEEATLAGLQKLRSPRVLVLGTHGFFLPDVPPATRQPEQLLRATARRPDNPLESPLLRSGLALAGGNRRGQEREGGLLTGIDVAALELRGCELVVLPACETTAGAVNKGDGVAGLRQAFHLAGARSVLATLWQTPARDTDPLLADFFGRLAKRDSVPEALRQAQLRRMEARRGKDGAAHLYFWAAFADRRMSLISLLCLRLYDSKTSSRKRHPLQFHVYATPIHPVEDQPENGECE